VNAQVSLKRATIIGTGVPQSSRASESSGADCAAACGVVNNAEQARAKSADHFDNFRP
jgi:hypothetical protein